MAFPTFAEAIGSKSALGVKKESVFRTIAVATAFTPFDSCTIEEDPGTFSPATMIGQISTDIYPMQGEAKVGGQIKMPLYATNGIPLFIGSVGQDAIASNGITGTAKIASAGTPGNTTSSTSFAATGVTSITIASATGSASSQCWLISGSTDLAGPEVVSGTLSATTITVTGPAGGTTKVHTGTITVKTCGALSSGSVSAGGGSIVLATGLGALFTTNDFVQIDVNGTTTSSEVHKVSVSSDTLTITDASPNNVLKFAHTTAVQVVNVTAGLWTHTIPSGTLDSFTIEKNIGGIESLQYPGCKIAKGSLSCPTGNNSATLTVDAMGAASPVVLATPTSASTSTEAPFIFSEAVLTTNGNVHPEAYNLVINWDNVLKETWGYSGSHYATFLTKTDVHVSGTFDAVWQNFDDAANGFWTLAHNQTQGALNFKMTHVDGSYVQVNLPIIVFSKAGQSYTVGNVVTQPIAFKAFYGLSSGTQNMVVTICSTQQSTPY